MCIDSCGKPDRWLQSIHAVLVDDRFVGIERIFEEVIFGFDPFHMFGIGQSFEELFEFGARAEVIVRAMDEDLWHGDFGDKIAFGDDGGKAHREYTTDDFLTPS